MAMIFSLTSAAASQAASTGPTSKAAGAANPFDDLKKYPGLLTEFGQLLKKVQAGIQLPPPRAHSSLLPLLPESTVFYAAFPNYGEPAHQALAIFHQEEKDNPALHAWWEHVQSEQSQSSSDAPKAEDAFEKLYQLSQYLGDEIVVSGAIDAKDAKKDPSFLFLAEVRKPGLKDLLQQMQKELAPKSPAPVRIFDPQELATAQEDIKDAKTDQKLLILVRPDFLVGALSLADLRSFNARLDKGSHEFAATPFGQRMAQAYEGGTTVVAGADLQAIVKLIPITSDQSEKLFQRTGFADVKYVVWDHKSVAGKESSQLELSFTGPRHGIASWLAAPGPLGSLDFVSPKAIMSASIRLKSPPEILDDLTDIASISNPNALMQLAMMEQGLNISLKKDLLSYLSGEITIESDGLVDKEAAWRAILKVSDPARLQTTLTTLLAVAKMTATQTEEDGITYHTFSIPSGPSSKERAKEIAYAFVDGYLVIASSHDALAESIRMHRSGESLAKSQKFLASLPPGNRSEVSAQLYEDPVAVAALTMRQVSPDMAELFSQTTSATTGETPAAVVSGYGEESAIREVSRSGSVDVGAGLIIAAIAIPNLLRARMAANESSAVASVRTVNTAQITYLSMYPEKGYARDLATLGPDPRGGNAATPEHASLVDATLGNASCIEGSWCTKSGYQFRITAKCGFQRCQSYVVVATPASTNTGTRSFCSTSDAVIHYKLGGPLTSPVTPAECRTWLPLR
jgi:type II secretory pathway pseudopilin PulG